MAVVANAGPLIAFARIEQLALLPALYGEVIVPPTVHREVTAAHDLAGASILASASWLRIEPVDDRTAVQRLRFWLDEGESEAIVLSQALGTTLLMDERRGRAIAIVLGLSVTGTAGVLLAAKRQGAIDLVTPLLDALRAAGIHLSQRIYEEARRLAGEA